MRLNIAWVYQFNIDILRIDPISNMLALTWLYCFVVVDNDGITINFLHKIIPRLSNSVQPMSILHDFKMKKNAPCFQIRAGDSWHWFRNGKASPRNGSWTGDPWRPDPNYALVPRAIVAWQGIDR